MCLVVSNCLQPHGLYPARLLQSIGVSRQEYWNELPFLSPGDLSNLGIEPRSPALQADSLPTKPPGKPKNTGRKAMTNLDSILKSRDMTLPRKVCIVKAMVFSVVMYRCECWTVKKAEH